MANEGLNKLDSEYGRIRNEEMQKLRPTAFPNKLYHYTSLSALRYILESERLWATEGFSMNDTAELRHAALEILNVGENLASEYVGKSNISNIFQVTAAFVRHDVVNRRNLEFLLSFSQMGDSLSQWRAYADNGAGVAIEFDLSNFEDANFPPLPSQFTKPAIIKCIYDLEQQRCLIERIWRCVGDAALAGLKDGSIQHSVLAAPKKIGALMLQASHDFAPFLKNPGFDEEEEWRISVRDLTNGLSRAIRFRDTKYGPAPFIKIPIGDNANARITGLVFGPRVSQAAKRVVRLLLDRGNLQSISTRDAKVSYGA